VTENFQPEGRLHPMSWLFAVMTFIRQFLLPLLAAAFFGSRNGMPLWLAIFIVPMIAAAVWKQFFYRYGCGPAGLVVREGIFFHNLRQIDYARIENIDTERNLLHRALGVAEVRVETSTGGKPEALIQVLSLAKADELRQAIFATRKDPEQPTRVEENETTLLHLPIDELVRFGLIDNRGMVVVAGLFGLAHEAGVIEAWAVSMKDRISPEQFDALIARGLPLQAGLALSLLLAALILVRLFSVSLALLTLYDFRLTQVGADLRVRYGSLTRVSLTLRLSRIQALHRTQTLLHRLFDRVSLRADLAGGGAEAEHEQGSATRVRWLAPISTPQRAMELAALALPDVHLESEPDWQPLASGARGRIFRFSTAWWLLASSLLAAVLRDYVGLLLLAIGIPMSFWYATMYSRYTRWSLDEDVLSFRSGWLTRKLVIVPRSRVQCALMKQSPFDRRSQMANVVIDTAGGGSRSDIIRIPYLDIEVAAQLAHALYCSSAAAGDPLLQPSEVEAV
jgi:putative membrane protein